MGGGCRQCYQLAYPSQREDAGDRAARRAHRIRDRLGWPGGVLEGGGWGKPKGMHWRTYERLCDDHDTFEEVVNPIRPMRKDLPLRRRPRRNRHLLALTINESGP